MLLCFLSLSSSDPFCIARADGIGLPGDKVPWRSSKSESFEAWSSENGNRPNASSIKETPSGQTSDLTVYWALEYARAIHCGRHVNSQPSLREDCPNGGSAHAHVSRSTDESVGDRIDQPPRHSKVADLDLSLGVEQDVRQLDICGTAESPRQCKVEDACQQTIPATSVRSRPRCMWRTRRAKQPKAHLCE